MDSIGKTRLCVPSMFSTIVPDGVGPGQEIHVQVPEGLPSAGLTVLVTVPPGSGPGSEIRVGDPKAVSGKYVCAAKWMFH